MKIYLAGPEVFLPNALETFKNHKSICSEHGLIGISPFDNSVELTKNLEGYELAKTIYLNNRQIIDECDIIVANCNSFRGPLVDDGTSWEIGYGFARGKTIYGYIDDYRPLPENVRSHLSTKSHESGYWMDEQGYLLNEDFGNAINLMLEFSIQESGGKLVVGNFEDCIKCIAISV